MARLISAEGDGFVRSGVMRAAGTAEVRRGVRIWGATRAGKVRRVNQDAFHAGVIAGRPLLLVADGIGGHRTGEVASQLAVSAVTTSLRTSRAHPPVALARAVERANREVFETASRDAKHHGMGTTLSAIWIDGDVALLAHVGDSRAYLLRDGQLTQLSEDHSWVADRVKEGVLSEREAETHRWRNVITNALGASETFRLDVRHHPVQPGDRLLVVTDGVSSLLSDAVVRDAVSQDDPVTAVTALLDRADERGSPDNITAVLAVIDEVPSQSRAYDLPNQEAAQATWSVEMRPSASSIRAIEARFPGRGLTYRAARMLRAVSAKLLATPQQRTLVAWSLGSIMLLLVFLVFALSR